MEKEIDWIDAVRTLCILMVFFAHSVEISGQGIPDWLYRLYDPVYVNAFFFVSGYLLLGKRPSASKLSGNILFRLVIPSVIFATIEFFPKMLLRGNGFSLSAFMADTLLGGTYWFVSALAVAQLLFMLLFLAAAVFCATPRSLASARSEGMASPRWISPSSIARCNQCKTRPRGDIGGLVFSPAVFK